MKILPKWYTFQVETGPFFNYYIQNKIKECLDDLNEHPGCGQVMQILFLHGIIEWFEHCDIDEKSKGYDEAQTLCHWVYERLIEVCSYYFMVFNENSDSEPLDNYLASTRIGRVWCEIENSRLEQQEYNKDKKKTTLPKAHRFFVPKMLSIISRNETYLF